VQQQKRDTGEQGQGATSEKKRMNHGSGSEKSWGGRSHPSGF
jgi:hypothetical protein